MAVNFYTITNSQGQTGLNDGNPSANCIARDSTGKIYCIYVDMDVVTRFNFEVMVAEADPPYAAWTLTDVSQMPPGNLDPKAAVNILIDASDNMWAFWFDNAGGVAWNQMYAYKPAAGAWGAPAIIVAAPLGARAALDSNGNPHLFGIDQSQAELWHYWWTGSGWSSELIAVEPPLQFWWYTIQIDHKDTIHIGYSQYTIPLNNGSVAYRKKPLGGSWSDREEVHLGGATDIIRAIDMAIDSNGYPHFVWDNQVEALLYRVQYKKKSSQGWQALEDVNVLTNECERPSISITGSIIHVIYDDRTNQDIRYRRRTSSWQAEEVISIGTNRTDQSLLDNTHPISQPGRPTAGYAGMLGDKTVNMQPQYYFESTDIDYSPQPGVPRNCLMMGMGFLEQ